MHRLKYVFGINIPRIPSSTAIRTENRTKEICRKHSSEMHLRPLLKTRLFSYRTRRINDVRSFHCTGPAKNETLHVLQRNKLKLDSISLKRTSLERNHLVDCVQRRRTSTYLLRRPSNVKRHIVQSNPKILEAVKYGRNSKVHEKHEAESSLEEEPRTYAQMIASYSQMTYTETNYGIPKDGLNMSMISGVHRSPFSTASTASLKWMNKSKGARNGYLRATNPNTLNQEAKFSSDTSTMCYEFQDDCKDFIIGDIEGKNKLDRSSSYASMIERYSNVLDLDGWNNNLIPKRNVSTNLNDLSSMLMDTTDKSMEPFSNKNECFVLNENSKKEESKKNQTDWMAKVEDVIKDLKRITAKDETVDSKSSEKWALQSVNEQAEWLDRVVSAHKKGKAKPNDNYNLENSTTMLDPISAASNQNRGPTNNPKSNSITDYFKRGSVGSNTTTSSQSPTNVVTGSAKQPQIELRMTPSQNESVVSINVDELAAKTASTSAKEQLSVVISSKGNKAKADTSNTNVRSNFDSMQISISENTVPIKQLEFSINGKPVSELKSIVARADKLDVFSSMDKVEIRIPQSENKQTNQMRAGANPTQVLNLQIAAKFNEPRAQQPKDAGIKTSTTVPPSPVSPKSPVSTPTPPRTPTQVPPYKPPTTRNFSPETTKNEPMKITKSEDAKNVKESENVATIKKIDDLFLRNDRERVDKLSAIESDVAHRSKVNIPSNTSQQPTINENSTTRISNDDRIPSNAIPWWSSEDSFKNIRKKENIPKNVSAFDDKLLKKVEEDTSVQQKFEQTFNPGGQFIDLVNFQKTDITGKNSTVKKPVVEENKSLSDAGNFQKTAPPMKDVETKPVPKENVVSYDSPNQNFRVVQARNPRKSDSIKIASKQRSKVKKMRYRVKRPRISITANKESENPIISAVRCPKVIKYVPVNPQRIAVNEKSETKAIAAGGKDEEALKASTKVKKVAEDGSPAEKINVQRSNTVFKTRKDLEKPANKSADISAASSTARERERRDESGKNFPSRGDPFEGEPDQRIKQILKSLKPIEKKKDGTLIDYGVVVPSRKPSTKFGQDPRTRSIDKFNRTEDTSREKIIEPQEVFSTNKEILIDPKNKSRINIVESEKISSIKKAIESKNSETEYKINKLYSSEEKKENREEKAVIVVKDTLDKNIKKNSSGTNFSDKKQELKVINSETERLLNQLNKNLPKINSTTTSNPFKTNFDNKLKNIPFEDRFNSSESKEPKSTSKSENNSTLPIQPFKASVKSSDLPKINNTTTSNSFKANFDNKLKNIPFEDRFNASESKEPKSTPKSENQSTLPIQPFKASVKSGDINFSKLKSLDKSESIAPSKKPEKSKNITISEKQDPSEEKMKLEGTFSARPPKVVINSSENIANFSKPNTATTSSERQDSKRIDTTNNDTNVTNFSKLNPLKKPTSQVQSVESTGSKGTLKSGVQEMVPLEEIGHSSRSSDKKVTRIDPVPLMGTIVSPSPPKSSNKATKSDSKSSGESDVRSGTKVINTETAPLEGTINYESIKKLDNLSSSKGEKKTLPEVIEQRKKDLGTKSDTSKSSSNKGGGSSGSNAPGNPPTGPAGLRSSRSIIVSQTCLKTTVSCVNEKLNRIEEKMESNGISSRSNQEYNHEIKLYSNEIERPEKNMLYSSWLQRFKTKLNDDKVT